jgi:DNA polymerase-3 subunit gamma/tau
LAKAVNCLADELSSRPCNKCDHCKAVNNGRFLDLIEIDAASNTSVDDVRDLRDKINFSPNQGRFKVYIVDEVHMLSTAAFNALLKTLEEPPPHAIFILATTEVHKIPATVLSRCQRHEFRRIPVNEIVASLKTLAESEGLEPQSEVLTLIARQATGSMRDAQSLIDQLASTSQEITLEMAQSVLGTAANQSVLGIVSAILANDSAQGLDQLHTALDAGSDPRQFARQIVDYLRDLLLIHMGNASQVDTTSEIRAQMADHAQAFDVLDLMRVIRAFNHAANDARIAWQPALPLELAFIESLDTSPRNKPKSQLPDSSQKSKTPKKQVESDSPKIPEKEDKSSSANIPVPSEPDANPLPQTISNNWRDILTIVRKKNPQTQALLNSCKPLGVKGGALILGFNGEFARAKMEQEENLKILAKAMDEAIGESPPVRCIMSVGGALPDDVDQDGMVASALRDLGGEIVDIQ